MRGRSMGLFLVFATTDLRSRVATTCTSFYTPLPSLAVVSYGGSAEQLARRLNVDRIGGPGALARCFSSRRALAVAACGALAILSAIRICALLI